MRATRLRPAGYGAPGKYDHCALRSLLQSLGISLRSATEPIDDASTGKLMGRVPIKVPPQRAHPELSAPRVRSLRVLWPSRADTPLVEEPPSTKVALREGATGAGLQVALEGDGSSLLGQLDGDVELPRTMTRRVGAATGIVVFEA